MIRTVNFAGWHFQGNGDSIMVLRKLNNQGIVEVAFPFLEDTPNIDLKITEAMDLRNALNDLIGPVLTLPTPQAELFPQTQISVSDQSAFSSLFDRFPTDFEGDKQARKALTLAAGILGLPMGAFRP
ncbi:hypothetical protein [Paenibacillus pabuli]|uniref:hypothetical protein n=1 Tax=Paenibacillus pabuli TaxID=1472 RepID=UPI001FFF880F|nr:hypothetical protein [Paenibacillus pabuli]UPK45924.1 hypothetical protein KET34_10920 [Paenibacillus pabuli]